MFGYVSYTVGQQCDKHEEKEIIHINKVKKYDKDNPRWQMYKIECGNPNNACTGVVLATGESKQELEKVLIEKRIKIPSKKLIVSPPSTSEDENIKNMKKKYEKKATATITKNMLSQLKDRQREDYFNSNIKSMVLSPIENLQIEPASKKIKCSNVENTEYQQDLVELQQQLNDMATKYIAAKKKVEKLKKIKAELQERNFELQEMKQLNEKLQNKVIDKFEKLNKIPDFTFSRNKSETYEKISPVGTFRGEQQFRMIHLGKNVWIPENSYNAACVNVKSPSMFVKNLSLAVFGHDVLIKSSVTGTKCHSKPDSVSKPPLNGTKMAAIKDIFRYWLIKERNFEEVAADLEISKVGLYISRKISDLCRPSKSTNGKKPLNDEGETRASVNIEGETPASMNDESETLASMNDEDKTPASMNDEHWFMDDEEEPL